MSNPALATRVIVKSFTGVVGTTSIHSSPDKSYHIHRSPLTEECTHVGIAIVDGIAIRNVLLSVDLKGKG